MNSFVQQFKNIENETTTENGNFAYKSTMNACCDFFYSVGSLRPVTKNKLKKEVRKVVAEKSQSVEKAIRLFKLAIEENELLALKILFWLRDIRCGAGERELFRILFKEYTKQNKHMMTLLSLIPEYGRYDDLWNSIDLNDEIDIAALKIFLNHSEVKNSKNDLINLCKWLPRPKGKHLKFARFLMNLMGFQSEKAYRKFLVQNTEVVETKMSANQWFNIDYSKVPSRAMSDYKNSFQRHTINVPKNIPESFAGFVERVEQGNEKINAGAIYPYDVYKSLMVSYGDIERRASEEQWKAIPNFIAEGINILPIIDVSGSMTCAATSSLTCIDIAVSLGVYCAERGKGPFKNLAMTFSDNSEILNLSNYPTLYEKFKYIRNSNWQMSTNIEAAFDQILSIALKSNCEQDELPNILLVLSDMQFNEYDNVDNIAVSMRRKFEVHGYKLPSLVFWNLNANHENVPVKFNENGTALISGFSPSIMKGITTGDIDPIDIMMKTIGNERYDVVEQVVGNCE